MIIVKTEENKRERNVRAESSTEKKSVPCAFSKRKFHKLIIRGGVGQVCDNLRVSSLNQYSR
jgi:hypothetical protein